MMIQRNKAEKEKGLNFLLNLSAIAFPLTFISKIYGAASFFASSYVILPSKNLAFSSLKKVRYFISMSESYMSVPKVSSPMYGKSLEYFKW